MPRLLRMPVVYLSVLLVLAAFVATWQPDAASPPARPLATTTALAEPPLATIITPNPLAATTAPVPPPAAPLQDEPILLTPEGLRRKALIRELGLSPYPTSSGGSPTGAPLDYFSIHFIRGETPTAHDPRFEIGPATGPAIGWVPIGSVLEWDTRLMAVPTAPEKRGQHLIVYRDRSCLLAALAHRDCETHASALCPIEAEEPTAPMGSSPNEPSSTLSSPLLGMPVLQSLSIPQPDGSIRTVHQVVVLVRDLLPLPAPTEPPPELRPYLRNVYLAFCIDTTQSMSVPIAAVQQFARRLAVEAPRRDPNLVFHLALVEYRDESPIFRYTTRRFTDFVSPDLFATRLDALQAASRGDDSLPESVFAGVAASLPIATEQPLSWPAGESAEASTRLLILVGDAPDHASDLAPARALARQAQQAGITIAAVRLEPPAAQRLLARSERQRLADQWRTLAEGSYRGDNADLLPPLDLSLSLASSDEPDPGSAAAIIAQQIGQLVDQRVAAAVALAARLQEESERRMQDYRTSTNRPLDAVAPVLVDSHSSEPTPTARPDPRHEGVKAPSLRRGWVAEQVGDEPLVRLGVLMSRAELDRLINEFLAVQSAATAGPAEMAALLEASTAATAGETGFLDQDRGSITFDEHLVRQQGLPPGRPDSLLRRTRADLLQADDLTRASLSDRLSQSITHLIRFREETDWADPSSSVGGMALVPYDWIDL